jgi:2-dehydro-3-deoxyphosphogluconate aldolase/(4S)-4-hydroxy-2-oxoglutarate aldolase
MARRYSKPVCPGALTPTEVLTAWESGADVVKVFPCGNVGGAKYIKALKGPFPQIEMIPTGGVNLDTAADFIRAGVCALGVGGELVDAKSIKDGKFEVITERAKQFLAVVAKARGGIVVSLQLSVFSFSRMIAVLAAGGARGPRADLEVRRT